MFGACMAVHLAGQPVIFTARDEPAGTVTIAALLIAGQGMMRMASCLTRIMIAAFDQSLSLSMRASERSRSPLRLDVDVHTDNDDFDEVAALPSDLATVWAELHEWQPNVLWFPIRLGSHSCRRSLPPLHHAA